MNSMQIVKLFSSGIVLCVLSSFASMQQQPANDLERVPTQRLRTDTFPRWMNPTYVRQRIEVVNDPPNGVTRFITSQDPPLEEGQFATFIFGSMTVDSGGVVHIVGTSDLYEDEEVEERRVFYMNNAWETRTASGFSEPVILETYEGTVPQQEYGNPISPTVCLDSDGNIQVFWIATWSATFSGSQGGVPYQEGRSKSDVFRITKSSTGWSTVSQVTNAVCLVDRTENYRSIMVKGFPGDGVVAAGTRTDWTYQWVTDPQNPNPNGSWQVIQTPGDTLCAWGNILQSQMPQLFELGSTVGSLAVRQGVAPLLVYTGLNGANQQHVFGRRLMGGTWGQPTDVCGVAAGPAPIEASGDIDLAGVPHYTFIRPTQGQNLDVVNYSYNGGASVAISTPAVDSAQPRIMVDSRGQPHVVYYGTVNWPAAGLTWQLFYAARVCNPTAGQLDPNWRRQDLIAAPAFEQEFEAPIGLGVGGYPWSTAVMGADDRIHCLSLAGRYTCTLEYGLGARDGAAQVPVMPGGTLNVASGNLQFQLGLFGTNGVSPTQQVTLHYNALDGEYNMLGPGWKLNYDVRLIDHGTVINDPAGSTTQLLHECMTLIMPDGRRIAFSYRNYGQDRYLVAHDEFGTCGKLERTSWTQLGADYRLTWKDGTRWTFNGFGKLREIQERTGNCITLVYDGNGYLQTIRDQTLSGAGGGRNTTVFYEQPDQRRPARINRIQDPSGYNYYFEYDGDRLSAVTLPDNNEYQFEYYAETNSSNGAKYGQLQEMRKPSGSAWTCGYRPDGRLVRITDPSTTILEDGITGSPTASAATLTVEYREPLPPMSEPGGGVRRVAIVRDRRGIPTRFECEGRRYFVREVFDATILNSFGDPSPGPAGVFSTVRMFDEYGNLTSLQDRLGSTTAYEYLPANESPHVYDDLQRVARDSVELMTYSYSNDEYHQVTGVTTNSGGTGRTTVYDYNSVGQLATVTHPAASLANGTNQSASRTFQYGGPRGALSMIQDEEDHETSFSNFHGTHGLPQAVSREGGSGDEETLYDVMGNVIRQKRPLGAAGNDTPGWTYINLDNRYRVASIMDPLGNTTTRNYNADSNLTSVIPPVGMTTTYAYDARGFATGGVTAAGAWSQWVNANGSVTRTMDARNTVSGCTYDVLNRVNASESQGSGLVGGGGASSELTTIYYDQQFENFPARVTAQGGTGSTARQTIEKMDFWGRATKVIQPDGITRTDRVYDEQGQVIAEEQRYGSTLQSCTVYFRDQRDRVYQTRRQNVAYGSSPTWSSSTYTVFNRTGAVVQSVGPLGNPTSSSDVTDKTTYELDERNRVVRVLQPHDGQMEIVSETVYGGDDLVIEERVPDPSGVTTGLVTSRKYTYTARKEVKTSLNANNKGLTYAYNALPGQVDTVTDAENRVSKTTYHSLTQRVNEQYEAFATSEQRKTTHVWDAGLLVEKQVFNAQTGSDNATWSYDYDRGGRLERMAGPQGAPEVYEYNAFSETVAISTGSRTETREFNTLGRETDRSVSGSATGNFQSMYDGQGNLTQVTDGTLRKDIAWDTIRGVPESETLYVGASAWKTINLEHDAAGRLIRMEFPDPSSLAHEWTYDDAGLLTTISVGGMAVSTMEYTRGGLLRRTTLRNESGNPIAETVHDYDSLGRHVRAHTRRTGNGATLSDLRWEHDHLDRITKIKYVHLGIETEIGYNARGEVVSEVTGGNGGGQSPPEFSNTFGSAPTGNESTASNEVQGEPGAVAEVADRTAIYVYDRGGNRISQTIDGVTTTFDYDSGSRLISENAPNRTVDHEYDELGNEVTRTTTVGSTTTVETYGYDAQHRMSNYLREVGSTTQASWQYEFWPTGERYSKTNLANDEGQVYAVFRDSVVADYTLDSSGVDHQNTYVQGLGLDQKSLRIPATGGRIHYLGDIVGTVNLTMTDAGNKAEECLRDVWGNTLAGNTNDERYGFAQREHDMESGLVYMRHRMYDPRVGRFTQLEPLKRQRPITHYIYADNLPNTKSDPTGEFATLQDVSTGRPIFNDRIKKQFAGMKGSAKCVILYLQYPQDLLDTFTVPGKPPPATTEQIKAAATQWATTLQKEKHCNNPIVMPIEENTGANPYEGLEKTLSRLKSELGDAGVNYLAIIGHGSEVNWRNSTGGVNWPTPGNKDLPVVPMHMGTAWRKEKKVNEQVPQDMYRTFVDLLKKNDPKNLTSLWQLDLETCYSSLDASMVRQIMLNDKLDARVGGLTTSGTQEGFQPDKDKSFQLWGKRKYYGQ